MKKYTATRIFDGKKYLPEGTVIICTDDGVIETLSTINDAGDDLIIYDGLIIPGMVNCHCHLELSHLKNMIPQHTGLVQFVQNVIELRNHTTPEESHMEQILAQMWEEGVVALGDICNTSDTINAKKRSPLYCHNFIEVAGFVPDGAEARMDAAKQTMHTFIEQQLKHTSIAAHAPYSVSEKLFSAINRATKDGLTTIHNQESEDENLFLQKKEGQFLDLYESLGIDIQFFKPSGINGLKYVLSQFTNNQCLLLVHNTYCTQSDIDILKQEGYKNLKNIFFVACVRANLYIEDKLPPLSELYASGFKICLGTDSLASNKDLSMLNEMKAVQDNFKEIRFSDILQWATSNGAEALQISHTHGMIRSGMKPGLVYLKNLNGDLITNDTTAQKIL